MCLNAIGLFEIMWADLKLWFLGLSIILYCSLGLVLISFKGLFQESGWIKSHWVSWRWGILDWWSSCQLHWQLSVRTSLWSRQKRTKTELWRLLTKTGFIVSQLKAEGLSTRLKNLFFVVLNWHSSSWSRKWNKSGVWWPCGENENQTVLPMVDDKCW